MNDTDELKVYCDALTAGFTEADKRNFDLVVENIATVMAGQAAILTSIGGADIGRAARIVHAGVAAALKVWELTRAASLPPTVPAPQNNN